LAHSLGAKGLSPIVIEPLSPFGDKLPDGKNLSPPDFGQLFATQPSTTLKNDLASRLD
jgi:hypothetical protein